MCQADVFFVSKPFGGRLVSVEKVGEVLLCAACRCRALLVEPVAAIVAIVVAVFGIVPQRHKSGAAFRAGDAQFHGRRRLR